MNSCIQIFYMYKYRIGYIGTFLKWNKSSALIKHGWCFQRIRGAASSHAWLICCNAAAVHQSSMPSGHFWRQHLYPSGWNNQCRIWYDIDKCMSRHACHPTDCEYEITPTYKSLKEMTILWLPKPSNSLLEPVWANSGLQANVSLGAEENETKWWESVISNTICLFVQNQHKKLLMCLIPETLIHCYKSGKKQHFVNMHYM